MKRLTAKARAVVLAPACRQDEHRGRFASSAACPKRLTYYAFPEHPLAEDPHQQSPRADHESRSVDARVLLAHSRYAPVMC